jgi:Lrp/AsnC family transcriptional regulator for asnA, asnC and gidA
MALLDDVDAKIIEILKKDSRTPFTEIASTLGVSDSTIHVRIKKLKDEGILLRYTVEINEELLGKKVHGLAMINVNPGHLEEVILKLTLNNRISKVYETHGVNDLIALLNAGNLDELRDLIVEIRQIKNISSTTLDTILKIWK